MNAEEFREYQKDWVKKNPEKVAEISKKWRSNNREKARESTRNWRLKNPEKNLEYKKRYNAKEENRIRNNVREQNRRAKIRNSKDRMVYSEWINLLDQYGNICLCCGSTENIQIDHIVPISKGGTHTVDNVQPLCKTCNQHKMTQTIDYRKK